jgi:hypothetical protein
MASVKRPGPFSAQPSGSKLESEKKKRKGP